MKRILFTIAAAASVSLLVVGCGSDSESDDSSGAATTAASAVDADEPAATGDIYLDTCNGVLAYIETMKESGVATDDAAVEQIGEEFITLAQAEPEWAGQSDQDRAEFERGVNAAIAGSC